MKHRQLLTVVTFVLVVLGLAVGGVYAIGATSFAQPEMATEQPDGPTELVETTHEETEHAGISNHTDLADANTTISGDVENETSGWSVSSGDVTGDGLEDLLIGAPEHNKTNGTGAAYLFSGPIPEGDLDLADANVTFTGVDEGDRAGWSVSIGNVSEADGNEVIIGAPGNDSAGEDAGAVYVMENVEELEGSTVSLAEANHTLYGESAEDEAGHALDALDYNATIDSEKEYKTKSDSRNDHDEADEEMNRTGGLLVGAPGYEDGIGAAYLFQTVMEEDENLTDALATFAGENITSAVGYDVAFAGDVDGNETYDAVIGAPEYGLDDEGAAFLLLDVLEKNDTIELVSNVTESEDVDAKFKGIHANDSAGHAVSLAGDFNDDGYDDITIGAPYNNATGEDAGSAYVLFGSGNLSGNYMLEDANVTLTGEAAGDTAGYSVSHTGPGDVTCDHIDDVLVGAPGNDSTAEDAGAAYVVAGEQMDENDLPVNQSLSNSTAKLLGEHEGDQAGSAVHGGYNLSGEKTNDVVVTAPYQDHHPNAGVTYVVHSDCPVKEKKDSFFDVEIVDKNDPIEEGETLEVTVEIKNTGTEKDTQDIRLQIDREKSDVAKGVQLAPGERTTVTLTWESGPSDVGDHLVIVYSDDDRDKQKITVTEPPVKEDFFAIEIIDKNDPVEAGKTLEVTAEVTNTGDETGEQKVYLKRNGERVDTSERIELAPSESETVTLSWKTGLSDVGEHKMTVYTKDDRDKQKIRVTEPPVKDEFFDVEIVDKNDPIDAGERLKVTAEITNTGDAPGTQDIRLEIDGHQVDVHQDLDLDVSETKTVTLYWQSGASDVGERTVAVLSDDDYDDQKISVKRPMEPELEPFFDVGIAEKNDPIEAGETLEVTVEITNTGDEADTQDIWLKIGSERIDVAEGVSLSPDETETVTLRWESGPSDIGDHWVKVYSEDDRAKQLITVTEPPVDPAFFDVEITDKNDPIEEGETLEVTAEITNTGDEPDTQDIRLTIDGQQVDVYEGLELGPNETREMTLTWQTGESDAGTHMVKVLSGDDFDKQKITVEERPVEEPFFEVTDITKTDGGVIMENETLTFNATIVNTGEAEGTQAVNMTITENETDDVVASLTEEVTLGPDENSTLTLTWEDTVAGNYTALVETEDDSDSQAVTVERPEEPPFFEVTDITKTDGGVIVENETLTFNATVTNTGETEGTQNVTLSITEDETNDTVLSETFSTTLGPGENTTLTLVWEDTVAGNYTALVETGDDSDSQPVTIERPDEPPFFEVSDITKTDGGVIMENEMLQFNATITNTGETEGTQNVTLSITENETNDTVLSETFSMTLGAGDSIHFSLVWEDTVAGNYTALVETEDDSDSQPVTVERPDETPFFEVMDLTKNDPITIGENLTVDALINNTGDRDGTQDVVLTITNATTGTQVHSDTYADLPLAEGASQNVSFADWMTDDDTEPGLYNATVRTDDNSTFQEFNVEPAPEPDDVRIDYRGCGAVWIVFNAELDEPVAATIDFYNESSGLFEQAQVTITNDDLETIPGQYGDSPLFVFNVHEYVPAVEDGESKIIGVLSVDGFTIGGEWEVNTNPCADQVPEPGEPTRLTATADPVELANSGDESSTITVEVTDAFGDPVSNQNIDFTHDGAGTLDDDSAMTDGQGTAQVDYTTAAPGDNNASITVTAEANDASDTIQITVGNPQQTISTPVPT